LRLIATWAVLNETCALLGSRVGKQAVARWPGVKSVGIGVPGLYYPEIGATRIEDMVLVTADARLLVSRELSTLANR